MDPFTTSAGDSGLPVIVGHRGAPRLAPENSPEAFRAAAATGARWVELDVRLSADAVPVVVHDAWLPTGATVRDVPWRDLRATGLHRLDDVLDGLPAGIGVDVEVKNLYGEPDYDEGDRLAGSVVAELRPRLAQRPWMISSFNPGTVAVLSRALPEVPAGLIHSPGVRMTSAVAVAIELGARVVCPHEETPDLGFEGVAAAHAAGVAVLVWTVDQPARAIELAGAGVDAICTNDPGALVDALGTVRRPP